MQAKHTPKIFETATDKLVHDALQVTTYTNTPNEWNTLQGRLNNHYKQNNRSKYIGFALLTISVIVLTTTLLYTYNKQTNTSKPNNKLPSNSPVINTLSQNTTVNNVKNNSTAKTFTKVNNTLTTKNNGNEINTNNINKTVPNYYNPNSENLQKNYTNNLAYQKTGNYKKSRSLTGKLGDEVQLATTKTYDTANTFTKNIITESVLTIEKNNPITPVNTLILTTLTTTLPNATTTPLALPILTAKHNNKLPKVTKRERYLPEQTFNHNTILYAEAYSGANNSVKNKQSFVAFLAPAGYNNKRLYQENVLTSMQTSMQLKLRKNHSLLTSGITYMQLGDRINYDTATMGSIALLANGTTKFNYLELPVIVGYEIAKNRWGLALQGGITAGVLVGLSGNYASIKNYNTTLYNVASNKSTFRRSIFNAVIAPQVQYYFNENTNLFVNPMIRHNLQTVTVTTADMQQRYNSYSVNVGIRTRL